MDGVQAAKLVLGYGAGLRLLGAEQLLGQKAELSVSTSLTKHTQTSIAHHKPTEFPLLGLLVFGSYLCCIEGQQLKPRGKSLKHHKSVSAPGQGSQGCKLLRLLPQELTAVLGHEGLTLAESGAVLSPQCVFQSALVVCELRH